MDFILVSPPAYFGYAVGPGKAGSLGVVAVAEVNENLPIAYDPRVRPKKLGARSSPSSSTPRRNSLSQTFGWDFGL